MTDLVPKESVSFENGQPGFAFTEVYRCFPSKGNGLLFRLVNETKKQWAFHNDTKDMIFRVQAKIGADSKIKAFGRTKITRGSDNSCILTCTVDAGRTERFLEGNVNDFELDFVSEAAPCHDVKFENGRPTLEYERLYKCFKNHGNGLLFRLVSEDIDTNEETWSYYNDTVNFVMVVDVTFANKKDVKPLGSTQVIEKPDDPNSAIFRISVEPRRTREFVRCVPGDFEQSFLADPVTNELSDNPKDIHFENAGPDPRVIAYPCSKIFRAFKDNGNGLMFLLVDEKEKKWAFYNDTSDYNITATVVFAPGSDYLPWKNTRVRDDPDARGGTICEITLPPNTTELFIYNGNPQEYRLSFDAESSNKAQPDENPVYENGGPDMSFVPSVHKTFKCFKERGNGLLFRVVDEANKRWFFYNDTKDVVFSIRVEFDKGVLPKALGMTQIEKDPNNEPAYTLEVLPLKTEMFIEGEVTGFVTKFSGRKHR